MPTKSSKSTNANGQLGELLLLAETESKNDRRSEKRFPFFRPVSVQVDDHRFSGFTREIGVSGIGLLHSMELPLKEVLITIAGRSQQLRLRIERCESIGEGWYISGGKLVDKNV
jgi:PilZ domain